ncbi:MAG: DUF4423 domain-containing protein [Bdellovibrionaceae bacterium]|nr:DUF4423 domain-containing protein [Bacteriovoracaceae bacterium]MCK6598482.1 DUF4423 domain-containing protein [Pseudobdellovibrionaceae bacterium]NUM57622.1 TIGR02147 family protein [Pseudobdellovibrionaceae bacterium]
MKKKMEYESSQILLRAFNSLKKNDSFSLRQWSQIVGISPTNLNLILNSKRLLPKKHIIKLAESLSFDLLAQDNLKKAHSRDWCRHKGVTDITQEKSEDSSQDIKIEQVVIDDAILLKSWLHLALLEFSTCKNFSEDVSFLADKFAVSAHEIKSAMHELELAGYLVRDLKGNLSKKNKKMRIPTQKSRSLIRSFHKQNLQKAIDQLNQFHDAASFKARLITGCTVAVNLAQLDQVKLNLERCLIDTSTKLSTGDCTEVYQLQLQFFPLSKKKS